MSDTVAVSLFNDKWTLLSAGSHTGFITNAQDHDLKYIEAGSLPAADFTDGHILNPGDQIQYYLIGSQKIYARGGISQGRAIVTRGGALNNASFIKDFDLEILKGNVAGHTMFRCLGERTNVGAWPAGEDVWQGSTQTIPTPAVAGEQMTLVSDSVDDVDGTGVGTRSVHISYLDGNGNEQSETINLNGTTPVNTVATDITFVNEMHTETSGSTGLAAGDITIYKLGSSSVVYNIIKANNNYALTGARKVPANKSLHLNHFHGSVTGNQPIALRLRSTDADGVVHPTIFNFKATMNLQNSALAIILYQKIPALSIIKVTAWAVTAGGNAAIGFYGRLVDD